MKKRNLLLGLLSLSCLISGVAQSQSLQLTAINNPFNILYLNKNSSFEKIFYTTAENEIKNAINNAIKSAKIDPLANNNTSFNYYNTNLSYKRILESSDLGLSQISVIPLSTYYNNFNHNDFGYIEYPFMFNNYNEVMKNYFNISRLTVNDINRKHSDSIALGLIPYSFKIFASNSKNFNPFAIQKNNIFFEKDIVSINYFQYFKSPDTINIINNLSNINNYSYNNMINDINSNIIIETNILDYYDRQLFKQYPNVYLTNHSLNSWVLIISRQWYNQLTNEERNLITQALTQTMVKVAGQSIAFNNNIVNQFAKTPGYTIHQIDYSQFSDLFNDFNKINETATTNPKLFQYLRLKK